MHMVKDFIFGNKIIISGVSSLMDNLDHTLENTPIKYFYFNALVKKSTGFDHWTAFEKFVFCKVLLSLDPMKVSL